MSDVLPFFRTWVAHPLRIASVVPSGKALGQLITSEISAGGGPVLELGPGNGRFYAGACRAGHSELKLVLVEYATRFAQILRQRYSSGSIHYTTS